MKMHLHSAIKGLWFNRWSTLLSIISIGICFFIFTGFFLLLYNVEIFTKKLSTKAAIVIYLKDDTGRTEISSMIEQLKKMGVFSRIQYISKDEAIKEMKNLIDPALIELIGYNPLSDTIEAFIKEESLQNIEQITKNIKKMQIVDDVYYPAKIIVGLKTIRVTLWNLAIAGFCLISIAILFIIYATVKSFYWKKTEEIEILKLLGATPSYIRFPFLVEGGIIGLGGTIFAGILICLVYFVLHSKSFSEFLPAVTQIEFPVEIFGLLPVLGMFLGIISSFFALGKIKYQ
ncbi:cell division protein FtsX [Thermodesulfovibrio yellowstonii]|uniref:Cell division protein FtsX n=2 Tax=Thermodesulfovibrio yellowstonii TaxID=28262 RepID=B5YG82_THEYD|nr:MULTISPECIES: permease-like cell division protein FtsX [Thermodesulfovibrio]ACI21374.1 efflux ABC transporter, permease protein [Thermodesulfovibrio yellowstonii DSM 11347]MDI6865202.1 permease-like cell division protein FtsX [Thermodesulfovibrio yellowstonii]GLI53130.1 cell division protein FtsX [Thermodesulfovibrio islandicus]